MNDQKYTIIVVDQTSGLSATVQAINTDGQWLAREIVTDEVYQEGGYTSTLASKIANLISEL